MANLKKKDYEELLQPLRVELCEMQRWVQATGQRVVIVFEGRDTAGKGGAISVFADTLNPRGCRVVALPKPTERERSQWYFQRYVSHLPAAGEIVLLDRSWYNRGGVEHVMGFCTEAEHRRFLKQAPVFEQMLIEDGILLFKYWFSVDQVMQEERFAERMDDPLKRWKISPIDLAARARYDDYTAARDTFFKATHTKRSPWFVVDANDQRRARLNMIAHLLDQLPDHRVPPEPLEFTPLKRKRLGKDEVGAPHETVTGRY
ncbi:MAG: polyphosphate kinase 2 [Ahniella sp.]|nr:polyphosphate kinase 2 [Ahniella sp.]